MVVLDRETTGVVEGSGVRVCLIDDVVQLAGLHDAVDEHRVRVRYDHNTVFVIIQVFEKFDDSGYKGDLTHTRVDVLFGCTVLVEVLKDCPHVLGPPAFVVERADIPG